MENGKMRYLIFRVNRLISRSQMNYLGWLGTKVIDPSCLFKNRVCSYYKQTQCRIEYFAFE